MPEPDDPCGARGGAGWICQLAAGHDGGHLQAVPEYSVIWGWSEIEAEWRENPPSHCMPEADVNAFVIQWLRGPSGPTGAMGMMGPPGRDATDA